VAASYGFTVTSNGAGTATAKVGSNCGAFAVANNTALTPMDLLLAADYQSVEANNVFSLVNQDWSIS
jgi:hypothetical protein